MGSIISKAFFIGNIEIMNTDASDVSERLDLFINKYESKFLTELLGRETYKLFNAAITYNTPPTAPTATSPFDALLAGQEFTDSDGELNKWGGFYNNELGDTYLSSPIANYIYWNWMRESSTINSGVGVVEAKVENSTMVLPTELMARAWNEMVDQLWVFDNLLNEDATLKAAIPTYRGFKYPPILYPSNDTVLKGNQKLFVKQSGWF